LQAQLASARAHRQSAELALASQISGVNTDVARLTAQLGDAKWELDQTTVWAPAGGYLTNVALRKGARVTSLPISPAMAFIDTSTEVTVVEINQIDARFIEAGQEVEATFEFLPGRILTGKVDSVIQAISTGQVQVSGQVATPRDVEAAPFLVKVKFDDAALARSLPAGSAGTAAIITGHVKASHIIRKVLLRQEAILNYVNPF